MGDVHHAWLDIGRAVQHFASHISCRGDDNELVEDADAREVAGDPFGVVFVELRLNALEEWANEGDLPWVAGKIGLLSPVGCCKHLLAILTWLQLSQCLLWSYTTAMANNVRNAPKMLELSNNLLRSPV